MPTGRVGISLATRSTKPRSQLRTRPTSRMAARAPSVPKVMIWATWSRPYRLVTYSIISPRRSSAKSMSMSGICLRSTFRKRSKGSSQIQRVDVGDAGAVADDAGGGRAAHAEGDALGAGVVGQVADDEDVEREAGLLDDLQLVAQPLFGVRRHRVVAPLQSLPAESGQVAGRGLAFGHRVLRQVEPVEVELEVALLDDPAGVGERLAAVSAKSAAISCWVRMW